MIPQKNLDEWADLLVTYSMELEETDLLQINYQPAAKPLALAVYRKALELGARPPILNVRDDDFSHAFYDLAEEKQLTDVPDYVDDKIKQVDAYLAIRASENTRALADVSAEKMQIAAKAREHLKQERVENTKWALTLYPTNGLAQDADMSLSSYESFVVNACVKDWEREAENYQPLKQLIDDGTEVRITGEETDLTMKIGTKENIQRVGIASKGKYNIPDGEVFTAPIKESVNGEVYFDLPAVTRGREVKGVRLTFENGKVVAFSAEQNEELLKEQLNTDDGARFLGELGIGTNFAIDRFSKNILFDEKIGGTVHMAIGSAYDKCLKRLVDLDTLDPNGLDTERFQELCTAAEEALRLNRFDRFRAHLNEDEEAVADAFKENWDGLKDDMEEQLNRSAVHWDFIKDLRTDGELLIDGETVLKNGSFVNIDSLP